MAFRDFAPSSEFGDFAQLVADRMLFGPVGLGTGIPGQPWSIVYGVFGVGILRRGGSNSVVLLQPLAASAEQTTLLRAPLIDPNSDPSVQRALKVADISVGSHDLKILRIPRLIRQAIAGTVVIGTTSGTVGPAATWAGYQGFLTAGHVAIGTTRVDDVNGNQLGSTVHALFPGTPSGASPPNVDVALIRVGNGVATTKFNQAPPLTQQSPVDLHLSGGLKNSTVLASIGWYFWPGYGNYVDLYMTNAACSAPGDSGAVVTVTGSQDAIGMVVGGTTTFTSYIQDISRQLAALRTLAGLGSLSL